jgi:hypothetical protein
VGILFCLPIRHGGLTDAAVANVLPANLLHNGHKTAAVTSRQHDSRINGYAKITLH